MRERLDQDNLSISKTKWKAYRLQVRDWDRPSVGTRRRICLDGRGGKFTDDEIPRCSGTP
jgi:hypothetical protein